MVHKPKNGMMLQIIIGAGLSVAMVFLLTIVGVDTKNIAERVIETKTEINIQIKQSEEISLLREEAAKAEDKQRVLENALPKKDELFSFPKEVTAIGTKEAVETNFSFGNEGDGSIGYNLAVKGSYINVTNFIRILENDIPFMNISSFNLVFGGGEYSANLSGNVFFNDEEK